VDYAILAIISPDIAHLLARINTARLY